MKRATTLCLALIFLLTACRLRADLTALPAPTAESTPSPLPPAAPPTTQSTDPVRNLRYSDDPAQNDLSLSLDVYPTTGANQPVMIYVHGGGWYRGNKAPADAKPAAFNARGFVFVSVNYRVRPEVEVKQEVQDVARAIAWVSENIAQYGGDPARIFLLGHSAGAHIVSLIGTDGSYLEAEGLSLADLQGVVSLDTQAYDLYTLISNLPPTNGQVYRITFGDDPEFWKAMSPQLHIAAGKNIPPFVIVYTGKQESRTVFSIKFQAALEQAGIPALLLPAPDKNHGQLNKEFGLEGDALSAAVFDWLDELLQ
jgi:arylformamidase